MEMKETIRRCLIYTLGIVVILFISFTQNTSAVSANCLVVSRELCTSEHFTNNLCRPGTVKNTCNLYGCKPRRDCCPCPLRAFMDKYNSCTMCQDWRDCKAEGKELLFEGNTTHDAVCGDDISPTTPEPTSTFNPIAGTTSPSSETKDFISTVPTIPDDDSNGNTPSNLGYVIFLGTLVVLFIVMGSLCVVYPSIPQYLNGILCQVCCGSNKNQASGGSSQMEQGEEEEELTFTQ